MRVPRVSALERLLARRGLRPFFSRRAFRVKWLAAGAVALRRWLAAAEQGVSDEGAAILVAANRTAPTADRTAPTMRTSPTAPRGATVKPAILVVPSLPGGSLERRVTTGQPDEAGDAGHELLRLDRLRDVHLIPSEQ